MIQSEGLDEPTTPSEMSREVCVTVCLRQQYKQILCKSTIKTDMSHEPVVKASMLQVSILQTRMLMLQ